MKRANGSCKNCENFHTLMKDTPCNKCTEYQFFKKKS